jgi:chromosome segregation ATPase
MEKHFLRQFIANNKEESIKKIKDELTFIRARIEHNKREVAKIQEEIKEDEERLATLQELLDISDFGEHIAIDYEITSHDKASRTFVVLHCEDGSKVVISEKLMNKITKAWSEI